MIVVPAIDLRGGRVVRLKQGDPADETTYGDDPVEMARRFEAEGAVLLHVVDLDAAFGTGHNREVVAAICGAVSIPVQTGGGLRTHDAVASALAAGAARAVLGTAAAKDPEFVREAMARHGDRIVVAVDVRDGRVMLRGWQESGGGLDALVPALTAAGAPRFLVTSIDVDGTLEGPDLRLYERVLSLTDRPVLASGGVSAVMDLRALAATGVEGVVVGKALYEGTLTLRDALHALHEARR
ncbi:MAG: 1-(5-phosphoribosyl)-5-[(5-phosphoribosylamino)methylideneamino]imidazole-4-carboxamide isomerase [Actinomycetota bacterium]|nr:1-(5-phosphoribosyl)-5-[(5-phosphoribosylamino)methylideneamino]imidazole-4-carboxamide isomerase [Actinomycetota bacterium]